MARYREASAQEVRDWARDEGYDVGDRGRFSTEIVNEFNAAHKSQNLRYPGGTGQPSNRQTNSRQTTTARSTRSTSDSRQARRAPARATRQTTETAPAQRQPRRQTQPAGEVATAVITPTGTGLSEKQMEQFNRMLADANAVTGYQNDLLIVRLTPAVA